MCRAQNTEISLKTFFLMFLPLTDQTTRMWWPHRFHSVHQTQTSNCSHTARVFDLWLYDCDHHSFTNLVLSAPRGSDPWALVTARSVTAGHLCISVHFRTAVLLQRQTKSRKHFNLPVTELHAEYVLFMSSYHGDMRRVVTRPLFSLFV